MPNPALTRQFGGEHATIDAALSGGAPGTREASEPQMTTGGVLRATVLLLAAVVIGAVFGWQNSESYGTIFWMSMVVVIGAAVVTVLRPRLARVTGFIYALAEGTALGAVSRITADSYEGIVLQALVATVSVFLAMLILYASGVIKVTERLRSTIILATLGIGLFYLVSVVLSFFGLGVPLVWDGGWLSIIVTLLVVVAAAFNLILDFDLIESGITDGAPAFMSWYAAFALMVTIVWLYLEILRLIVLIRSRN